jgi:hypothetical protein
MSEPKQFFSPAAIANELAQRVIAMVTAEDRRRGVECDPNELLSWAKQWLLERSPLGSADTLESLSAELCEAFFSDGGATTGDSPSAEMITAIIKKAAERDGKFNPDELHAVSRAILTHADEANPLCWTWIQAQRITADDTLRSLRDGYVTACQK